MLPQRDEHLAVSTPDPGDDLDIRSKCSTGKITDYTRTGAKFCGKCQRYLEGTTAAPCAEQGAWPVIEKKHACYSCWACSCAIPRSTPTVPGPSKGTQTTTPSAPAPPSPPPSPPSNCCWSCNRPLNPERPRQFVDCDARENTTESGLLAYIHAAKAPNWGKVSRAFRGCIVGGVKKDSVYPVRGACCVATESEEC